MTVLPAALSFLVSLLLLASFVAWVFALGRYWARKPLLAYEPRKAAPWSLFDIFLMIVCLFALYSMSASILGGLELVSVKASDGEQTEVADLVLLSPALVLNGVASLLACGLGGLLIVLRTGARWGQDLGLTLRHAGRDIWYGVVAYALVAPVIMSIQVTLQHFYPSEHPLIESFRSDPKLSFYLVCVFTAAIVAPIMEEFLCRVLLQGWLERIFAGTSLEQALFSTRQPEDSPVELALDVNPTQGDTSHGVSKVEVDEQDGRPVPLAGGPNSLLSFMPVIISSLVFAALHLGHGLDPIPLFVLAIWLGYLYQRTHRILPCIVLHFLVNAVSLAVLALSLVVE
jgi:membrane protease YdiL (CAAX protease family)